MHFLYFYFLATECFGYMRQVQKKGPLVNSELYVGWVTNWNKPRPHIRSKVIEKVLKHFLAINASFNFYMFHGGTNFGLTSGAVTIGTTLETVIYLPITTSYDFAAPLSEAGDPTENYYTIQRVLKENVSFRD